MKIAFFTDTFYPEVNGVATSCLTLKRALEKRGHEVHVYAPKSRIPDAMQESNVHLLPSLPLLFLKDRNQAFYSPRVVRSIVRQHYDVIHTHSEFFMGSLGMHAAHRSGAALVHTYHTVWEDYTSYISKGVKPVDWAVTGLARTYSRWWCNRCDRIVTPTAKTQDLLRSYGEQTDIDIVPSGMDIGRFSPTFHSQQQIASVRQECGVKPGERVLLYIGRLAPEKNLQQLMRVFPRLLQLHGDIRFVIVGEGPSLNALSEQAENLGVSNHVSLTGPKPWDRIDQYYAMGDVFCSCSHSETQGLTYIEAMASGLCVAAMDDPCLQGVIESGVNGFLAKDNDDALVATLCRAFGPQGDQVRQAAIDSAARYGTAAFAEAIEQTYLRALGSDSHSRHLRSSSTFGRLYLSNHGRRIKYRMRKAGKRLKAVGKRAFKR